MGEPINSFIRLGLIGSGGFGLERARAIHASTLVALEACYSPILEESLTCQREFGGRIAESAEDIFGDSSIQGVILTTPNQLHLEQTLQAAAAGKHVLIEKPIALSVEQARRMVQACDRAGVTLMVGHNFRRFDHVRRLKSLLEEDRLGTLLAAEAHFSHSGGLDIAPDEWRWHKENCPGGPLIQLGIHEIDSLLYLLGPVRRVSAWQRRLILRAQIDDTSVTLLEFENGMLGTLSAHYAVPSIRYMNILASKANARWDIAHGMTLEQDGQVEAIPLVEIDTLLEEIDEFALCIQGIKTPEVDGWGGIAALAVVEAALKSNQLGRPVEIAEVLESGQ